MKIRKPSTTATIWSSGKITCTGAKRYKFFKNFLLDQIKKMLELN